MVNSIFKQNYNKYIINVKSNNNIVLKVNKNIEVSIKRFKTQFKYELVKIIILIFWGLFQLIKCFLKFANFITTLIIVKLLKTNFIINKII